MELDCVEVPGGCAGLEELLLSLGGARQIGRVATLTPLSQLPEESREYREPLEFMRRPGGSGPGSPGSPGSPNSMALPSSENAFVIEDSGTLHVFPLL